MNVPTFDLRGKVALVTGGSKGIGFGMAQALGTYGAKVLISGRGLTEGKKAEEKLRQQNIEATFYPFDVSIKDEVKETINTMIEEHQRIDILVNNAGMNIRKPLIDVEEEDWDKVVDINLKGIFLVGQMVAKQMIQQKYGKIINISSILGTVGSPYQTSYAASKGGINQLTRVWAAELAPYHITVNAIGPGYIKTPMTSEWLSNPERYNQIVESTMINRIGEVSDLVGPVVFLASDTSSYVTGQILHVDGGWTAR
jgi:gluconate 5-dehydrogenase